MPAHPSPSASSGSGQARGWPARNASQSEAGGGKGNPFRGASRFRGIRKISGLLGQRPWENRKNFGKLCVGTANGIRTRVATLKAWSPGPLDDGGVFVFI